MAKKDYLKPKKRIKVCKEWEINNSNDFKVTPKIKKLIKDYPIEFLIAEIMGGEGNLPIEKVANYRRKLEKHERGSLLYKLKENIILRIVIFIVGVALGYIIKLIQS